MANRTEKFIVIKTHILDIIYLVRVGYIIIISGINTRHCLNVFYKTKIYVAINNLTFIYANNEYTALYNNKKQCF